MIKRKDMISWSEFPAEDMFSNRQKSVEDGCNFATQWIWHFFQFMKDL